jgi:hypothetical protein
VSGPEEPCRKVRLFFLRITSKYLLEAPLKSPVSLRPSGAFWNLGEVIGIQPDHSRLVVVLPLQLSKQVLSATAAVDRCDQFSALRRLERIIPCTTS